MEDKLRWRQVVRDIEGVIFFPDSVFEERA